MLDYMANKITLMDIYAFTSSLVTCNKKKKSIYQQQKPVYDWLFLFSVVSNNTYIPILIVICLNNSLMPALHVHNVYIKTASPAKNPFPRLCTILHSAGLRYCEIPRKCPTVGHSITASNASERIFKNLNVKGKCTKNGGMHGIMKGLGIFRFMFPCVHCVRHLTYTQTDKSKSSQHIHTV